MTNKEQMKIADILPQSIASIRSEIHSSPLYSHPTSCLWQKSLSSNNQFCRAVVKTGLLTWDQMLNVTCRYCLGITKRGGVIFWQIDQEGQVHDGKVMYYQSDCHRCKSAGYNPTWVSYLLARRHHMAKGTTVSSHCFFGLHLLSSAEKCSSVCIVEAEKTACILSEKYPDYIWLAAGGLGEVQTSKFRALRGRKVILFPDTDPDGTAFQRWYEAAEAVMASDFWEGSPPIHVSSLLERHATAEQKERKIDLVEFLMESEK